MKPFTFAEWLHQGQRSPPGGRLTAGVPAGIPLAVHCAKVVGAYSTRQRSAGPEAADDLQNTSEGYYRRMPANYGLYNSINTATFAEVAQLDICGIQKMVDAVGLHSGLDGPEINMHQLGNVLGGTAVSPLSMATAFATFAADGSTARRLPSSALPTSPGGPCPASSLRAARPWSRRLPAG